MVFPPLSPPQRPHFLSCDKPSVTFPAAVVNFPTGYISARAKAKQRKPANRLPLFVFTLCFGTELVFADAAQRADPIFGDGFPRRAGGDAAVWKLFMAVCSVLLTVAAANWISEMIEQTITDAKSLTGNIKVVLGRVVRIFLMVIAVIIGLGTVGIDLTILSVFGGALGVGLGFGLQKIASNYVSGFIILLDKSVKIGDLVTVGGFTGKVTEINTRFTVVRSAGGVESIVPNESFVTSQVQNLSYSDSPTLQTVEISVAYNADVKKALELMLDEVGRDRPRIPKDRKPWASVSRFASSGIDLNVNFWVEDPVNGTAGIKTDIMMNLLRRFAEAGIEIPYNRLEIDILNNKNKALENQ